MQRDIVGAPYRIVSKLIKYASQEAYERGEVEAVIEESTWYEADGTPITDPVRLAQLEASVDKEV